MKVRWSNDPSTNGKRVRGALDQLDAVAEPATCDRQHVRALIEAGHPKAPPQELLGDEAGPGCDIEDMPAGRQT